MAQLFGPSSNTVCNASLVALVLGVIGSGWAFAAVYWSPYTTWVGVPRDQPVPFSHKHHAGELGIDCRYCHISVEKSRFAGVPSTDICMTCHSRLWTQANLLEPVRQSLATRTPLRWNRVNDLPDFVYFDHSIHVKKGVGCATCHGAVDQMPLTWKANTLYMKWCLECHRDPAAQIRPQKQVFNMQWRKPDNQEQEGRELVVKNHVDVSRITDCTTCHR